MNYQITSDNMTVSPSMDALAKTKFERVSKRFQDVEEDAKFARIVLNTAPNETFHVKANITIGGRDYFSDDTNYNLETAMINTVEEILQMIEKDKDVQDKTALKEEIDLVEEIE
jgi:ribosome-associated translation inhibitor RaiA